MILHAQSGFRGTVWDLDTGLPVRKVIWFDTERNELEAYSVDSVGRIVKDDDGSYLTYKARGRFKYVPEEPKRNDVRVVMGAPHCARCRSRLTLRGSDLCAFCNARDRGYQGFHVERITSPFVVKPCDAKGCSRSAEYQVADEVTTTPVLQDKRLWDTGAVVNRRWFCAFHFQPPRLLDSRGEVINNFENEVRPDN